MSSLNLYKTAIDTMTVMQVAVANIRLYPPVSSIVRNSIDRVYQLLTEIFTQENAVIFAESGKKFIICGHVFSDQDQVEHPQALVFIELLKKLGVKSIAFENKLSKPELSVFLEIISKSPEDIERQGGLRKIIRDENLPNIITDHKVYVVLEKDQPIVTSFEITNEDIVKYFKGKMSFSDSDLEKIKEMAKDAEWVNNRFTEAIFDIMATSKSKSYKELFPCVSHLLETIDKILDKADLDKITKKLALSVSDMDDDLIILILTQMLDSKFNTKLFNYVINKLNDNKFESIYDKFILQNHSDDQFAIQSYEVIINSDDGENRYDYIKKQLSLENEYREELRISLENGINNILEGDEGTFLDEVVMDALPDYLEKLFNTGQSKAAEVIMSKLSSGLYSKEQTIRHSVLKTLSYISRMLVSVKQTNSVIQILDHLLRWIKSEENLTSPYEKMLIQLEKLAQSFIREHQFIECMPILNTLNQIYYEKIKKPVSIKNRTGKILRGIASQDILEILLKEFQTNDYNMRQYAAGALIQLGEVSIDPLLDMLQESRDMYERARILQTVSDIEQVPRILVKKIREDGPWYYLRNLILMLGRAGTQEHVRVLVPFLTHEDFRVQRETLNSIYNIGGTHRGRILLSALRSADERMQINIVEMLGALQYEDAVVPLMEMLDSKTSQASDRLKERICMALGRIGSEKALPVLQSIANQEGLAGIKTYLDNIKEAAAEAVIKVKNIQNQIVETSLEDEIIEKYKSQAKNKSNELKSSPKNHNLKDYNSHTKNMVWPTVSRNDDTLEESVVTLLFESIVKYAKEKNFEQAELLRKELIQVDSMALTEIIKSGEIIEAYKNESSDIEVDHLGVWPDLYDTLTAEEANALYYAMQEAEYDTDQIIFEQGKHNDCLWFIRQGQLKLIFTQGKREGLVKTLGAGDIVGEDTFFSISVCTTSLITLSPVKVNYLNKTMLEIWGSEFPALESKLHDYCLKLEMIHDILKGKGMDRRTQQRIDITGIVFAQLLDASNEPIGKKFKGSLADISIGGISFQIKTGSKKNVSLLLGRNLDMDFNFPLKLWQNLNPDIKLPNNDIRLKLNLIGKVIGISHLAENNYSIHIKFNKLLGDVLAKRFENALSNN